MKITIIGGDVRLKILKTSLESNGYSVDTIGLFEGEKGDIKTSDAIILPVPTTKDGKTVFAPITNEKIYLSDIEDAVNENQLIFSCNYTLKGKECIDYGALDSYALLNAVPTAEGAIKIAIENTDFTLFKSKILVIGYGRVGKVLAHRLKSLGAFVTVSARKSSDFALIDSLGFDYINTQSLKDSPLDYDIVFNTVDFNVLPDSLFKNSQCSLIIDLSSKGGFNIEAARKNGIIALNAPGLPGKTAPKTAADILFKTITEILDKR